MINIWNLAFSLLIIKGLSNRLQGYLHTINGPQTIQLKHLLSETTQGQHLPDPPDATKDLHSQFG